MFLVFQGGELARQSALQNGDVYSKFYYDDARTMYESFLRGLRVSSTYVPSVCWCSRRLCGDWRSLNWLCFFTGLLSVRWQKSFPVTSRWRSLSGLQKTQAAVRMAVLPWGKSRHRLPSQQNNGNFMGNCKLLFYVQKIWDFLWDSSLFFLRCNCGQASMAVWVCVS